MKQLFILPLALLLSYSLMAINPTKKNINKEKVEKLNAGESVIDDELQDISATSEVIQISGVDYQEFITEYPELASKVSLADTVNVDTLADDGPPLGVPSFAWGFCFGVLGILLVYLLMDDTPERKEQVKKAFVGCLIGSAVSALLYFVVLASSL